METFRIDFNSKKPSSEDNQRQKKKKIMLVATSRSKNAVSSFGTPPVQN